VRSNAVLAFERTCAYSSIVTYLCSPDTPLRASVRPCSNKQCSATFERTSLAFERTSLAFERTSLAFERTCRVCYIFAWLRSIVVPALKRTSAAAAADPRQVCVLFSAFSYFIYLLCLCFIYFLVVFSFC
jgi:hypothetical protein